MTAGRPAVRASSACRTMVHTGRAGTRECTCRCTGYFCAGYPCAGYPCIGYLGTGYLGTGHLVGGGL